MSQVCLQAKGPYGLSKDPGSKRCPNILWKEESKEIKDFMKVEKEVCIIENTIGFA
jgi:hypothetical protein